MAERSISVIVATTQKGGIGKDGALPWKLPEDMAHFKKVTTAAADGKTNAVIMGRKTWESIPPKFRPLSNRVNVVLSRSSADPTFASGFPSDVLVASSVKDAVAQLATRDDISEIFAIGGESVYKEAVDMASCSRIFLTRIAKDIECDAFFPAFDESLFTVKHVSKTKSHGELPYDFVIYEKNNEGDEAKDASQKQLSPSLAAAGGVDKYLHEEYHYLNLIDEIMRKGITMDDRTGVGTVSIFGTMMRFDLRTSFPLLTTKRVFWRGVVEELLWFVRGDTNGKHLSDKGVKIWDGNGSREFLDKRGLSHREEGDLGPVYGFQWRHFGAKYVDMHTDYAGQGVDQLAECIRKIKEDPTDRRIIMSAWNPADLALMALPPCHMFCQFYVANGELSCLMYQRSCDVGLGVPFNIASYSLLTCMIAQICGLKPGDFVHQMGNTHVYSNHVEPLKTQLARTPRPFPVLRVNPDVKDIDSFQASDFELSGYNPHGKIAMDMAV
jgi:dihydrofolate reductase/thymidylate synthase